MGSVQEFLEKVVLDLIPDFPNAVHMYAGLPFGISCGLRNNFFLYGVHKLRTLLRSVQEFLEKVFLDLIPALRFLVVYF